MVLILNQEEQTNFPESMQDFYKCFPTYGESANTFLLKGNQEIGPKGILYVVQSEFAVTIPQDDKVSILGSDDATTCLIVVIKHSSSGATALAHFDGTDIEKTVSRMITRVEELSGGNSDGRIEAQLVGGYSDERYYSEQIFFNTMHALHSHPMEIHITLACVGDLNTRFQNDIPKPIVFGAGVDLKTGEIFPATFPEKGPDIELRHARLYSPKDVIEIYDCVKGILKIGPFDYKFFGNIDYILKQDDAFLLQHLSTSPYAEPSNFSQQTRKTLKFLKENPNPLETVFKNGKPHIFKRSNDCSSWLAVEM